MAGKKEKDLIKKLRLAMIEKGFNQSSLAKEIGLSHTAINAWLHGKANPSLEALEDVAKATNKPLNYFFSEVRRNGNAVGAGAQINAQNDLQKDLKLLSTQVELLKAKVEILEQKLKFFEQK